MTRALMNTGPNEIDAAARRSEDHLRLVIDIEDRKWAETLLAGENRILEMIARGNPLPSLLDTVCRLVEEISSGSLCPILLLDPNGNRLSHGAAPSLPKSYTDAIDGRAISTCWGPCGMAAYRKEPVIVSDLNEDPLWVQYRDLPLAHGLRSTHLWHNNLRGSVEPAARFKLGAHSTDLTLKSR